MAFLRCDWFLLLVTCCRELSIVIPTRDVPCSNATPTGYRTLTPFVWKPFARARLFVTHAAPKWPVTPTPTEVQTHRDVVPSLDASDMTGFVTAAARFGTPPPPVNAPLEQVDTWSSFTFSHRSFFLHSPQAKVVGHDFVVTFPFTEIASFLNTWATRFGTIAPIFSFPVIFYECSGVLGFVVFVFNDTFSIVFRASFYRNDDGFFNWSG